MGLYCILQVIQVLSVLTFLGSVIDRVIGIGTLWIENGELPLDDTLTLCSFILGFSGLAKLIKYLGRDNRIYLWISIVLSLIAIGLTIAAAFLKLIHENRVTTLKFPSTFGLCAYLCIDRTLQPLKECEVYLRCFADTKDPAPCSSGTSRQRLTFPTRLFYWRNQEA